MDTKTSEGKLAKITRKKTKEQREHQEARNQLQRKYLEAMQRAFATADGKILLHYLKEECGYQKNSCQGSTHSGELLENNTMYNEGRRDLYLRLRKFVRSETLAAVEVYGVMDNFIKDDNYDDMLT